MGFKETDNLASFCSFGVLRPQKSPHKEMTLSNVLHFKKEMVSNQSDPRASNSETPARSPESHLLLSTQSVEPCHSPSSSNTSDLNGKRTKSTARQEFVLALPARKEKR
jgi:hypothetical protein